MMRIPFLRPNLVKKETYEGYLAKIDESRWYSNYGPLNTLFEQRVLAECFENQGAATTVNNATTGLMLAISASKRSGRYALMPSFTFAATPLAALWCGLEPYFIDIRPDTWCMDEQRLEEVIKKLGDEVAIVVTYATFGTCLDLSYYRMLHDSGVPVVVDAAASFGTTDQASHFGRGFPGAVVFSFHATKAFGIGEGGLVYSDTQELIATVRQAGNFGFSSARATMMQGLNGKLLEYAAAVALATLDDFPRKIETRRTVYQWYGQEFQDAGLFDRGWVMHDARGRVPFQFVSVLCPQGLRNTDIVQSLNGRCIEGRTYFDPACHQQPYLSNFPHSDLPVTEEFSKRIVSLPLWEEMSREDVSEVISALV